MELILNLLESLAGFKGHQNWAIGPQKFSWQSRLGPSYDRRHISDLQLFHSLASIRVAVILLSIIFQSNFRFHKLLLHLTH